MVLESEWELEKHSPAEDFTSLQTDEKKLTQTKQSKWNEENFPTKKN